MYCAYCGEKLDTNMSFCPNCGEKVEAEVKQNILSAEQARAENLKPVPAKKKITYRSFWWVLVLLGALPWLLGPIPAAWENWLGPMLFSGNEDMMRYTSSILKSSLNLISPILFVVASAFCICVGFMMKKGCRVKSPLIICTGLYTVSGVSQLISLLSVYVFPKLILALQDAPESLNEYVWKVLFSPVWMLWTLPKSLMQIFVSAIAVLLLVIVTRKASSAAESFTEDSPKCSYIGILLMIVACLLTDKMVAVFNTSVITASGTWLLEGNSIATISKSILFDWIIAVPILVAVAFVLARIKNTIVNISVTAATFLWAAVLVTFAQPIVIGAFDILYSGYYYRDASEVIGYAIDFFRCYFVSDIIMAVALVCWFYSAARNKQPLWAQIVVPLTAFVIQLVLVFAVYLLRFVGAFDIVMVELPQAITALYILIFALALRQKKKKPMIQE